MQNLVKGLFRKKDTGSRYSNRKDLDESFERVISEMKRIDDWEDPRRIQRYILDSCEQIIATARILQREHREYELMSEYLSDIRTLQTMPKEDYRKLRDAASNLIRVSRSREAYSENDLKLAPEKYVLMARNEQKVPDTILRLQENEKQQSKIRRSMQQLDAKKDEYEIERAEISRTITMMRKVTALVFASLLSVIALFLAIQYLLGIDVMWVNFGLMLAAVCYVVYLFYQRSSMRRRSRELVRSLNRTISNLNVVRMKYANVTSSVDSDTARYGVNNSYELNYLWELYLSDASRKRQRQQDSADYLFYNGRLRKMLEEAGIRDIELWMRQPEALLDRADLQVVNRKLTSRRGELKEKITSNTDRIRSERADINDLMREHDYYEPEIVEILATVDRRCGLNTAYKFTEEENIRR